VKRWLEALRARPRTAALGAGILLLLVWWIIASLGDGEVNRWVRVEREELVIGVDVTGTLRAVDTSSIGPPQIPRVWEYKISMLAPEGDDVEEGQPVLGFDTTELQRRLMEMMAEAEEAAKEIEKKQAELTLQRERNRLQLAEAEARLRKARLKVEVPGELTSEHDLRKAALDLQLAEDEIDHLRKRLEEMDRSGENSLASLRRHRDYAQGEVRATREAIESMAVKAPRDGTVIYVSNWMDEKKKVGDTCWQAEKVLEIPNLSEMMADGEVDEADASKVALGQKLTLRLDSHPDEEFSGSVSHIWGTVQRKSWRNPLKIVRLDIDLDRTDERRMRPGMRFRGTIEVERLEGAVVIPIETVFVSEDGPTVYRKTLFGHQQVPVTLGRRNDKMVEVLDGLDESDRVSRIDPTAVVEEKRET
jgi:multidrug efflux pump subunit AcrA (membrane-fusion protein)